MNKDSFASFIIEEIRAHAEAEYPRESCGVVIVRNGKQRYVPCANISSNDAEFCIKPEDYAAAEERGDIICIVHSHPDTAPVPSEADRVGCELSQLPWLIVNWPTGQFEVFEPSGYEAPLIGRPFAYGVLDCFSLMRDYYRRELGIIVDDKPRHDYWWERGEDWYVNHFEEYGFVEVTDGSVKKGDVFFMMIGAKVANHVAIYVGDNMILHHCLDRLSSRDIYGGYWKKCTVKTVRHRSLCNA